MSEQARQITSRASHALGQGDHETALRLADEALAVPGFAETEHAAQAHHVRGEVLTSSKRLDEALEAYESATQCEPTRWRDHYNVATTLIRLSRPEESLVAVDRALELNSDYAQAWVNRGMVLFMLKRPADSRAALERATVLAPELTQAWRNLGVLYAHIGALDLAIVARRKVTELAPNPGAFVALALAEAAPKPDQIMFEEGGRDWRVLDAYEQALALRPDDLHALWGKIDRLARLAHGLQSAQHAGLSVSWREVAERYLGAAEDACRRFPDDANFAQQRDDAHGLLG